MLANDVTVTVTVTVTANFETTTESPELTSVNPFRAWIHNGLLHITGLTAGETLSINSTSGVLVYQNVAANGEADILLYAQGMYVVKSGDRTVLNDSKIRESWNL